MNLRKVAWFTPNYSQRAIVFWGEIEQALRDASLTVRRDLRVHMLGLATRVRSMSNTARYQMMFDESLLLALSNIAAEKNTSFESELTTALERYVSEYNAKRSNGVR